MTRQGKMPPQNIAALIFDCDGVLLESVHVKTEAFRDLFAHYPQQQAAIVQYHIENGGVSRFDKFRYFYERILKEPLSEQKFSQLCDDFERLVGNKMAHCPFVPGAVEFLKKFSGLIPMFVVSGTPHSEIGSQLERQGIAHFFQNLYGSPTAKGTWVKKILTAGDFSREKTFFIGDSLSDYEAAEQNKIRFIGRTSPLLYNPFYGLTVSCISDLTELENCLIKNFHDT